MKKPQMVKGLLTGLLIVHSHAYAAEKEGESFFLR